MHVNSTSPTRHVNIYNVSTDCHECVNVANSPTNSKTPLKAAMEEADSENQRQNHGEQAGTDEGKKAREARR